jgi:hypothetical protein
VNRVVAVENKPDLTASAARDLADQLRTDVDHRLADEVWVATSATGERVEPVLLEDLPVEAGVLVFDFEADDPSRVAWRPRSLRGRAADAAADPGTRDRRLGIAERAYGRGWRSFEETMRPDCRHFQLRRDETGRTLVPWCVAHGREQESAECAAGCGSFEPEPPAWRQRGWPLDGGPGNCLRRRLAARRDRLRN